MADQLNVLVICGSLRKGSFNAALARALPALAPPEMKLTSAPSFARLPALQRRRAASRPDPPADVEAWPTAIRAADGVIIVSPEYNWSIPGPSEERHRLGLDARRSSRSRKSRSRCSRARAGRSAAPHAVSPAHDADLIDAQMFGKPEVFVNFAAKKFDEKTLELTDQAVKDIVKMQLAAFAKFIAAGEGVAAAALTVVIAGRVPAIWLRWAKRVPIEMAGTSPA